MGEKPSAIINWFGSDLASCSAWILIPDKMCLRYLGFVLLVGFPGALHGMKIEFLITYFTISQHFSVMLSFLFLFQHKVQQRPVQLPDWRVVILPLNLKRMLMAPTSLMPVILDINHQWKVGGHQAHVKMAHGFLNHNV